MDITTNYDEDMIDGSRMPLPAPGDAPAVTNTGSYFSEYDDALGGVFAEVLGTSPVLPAISDDDEGSFGAGDDDGDQE